MPHFSTLTWRIIAFNAIALVVLTAGVILVQTSGRGLVEERLTGVQCRPPSSPAPWPNTPPIRNTPYPESGAEAEPLLRELIAPTGCGRGFICPTAGWRWTPASSWRAISCRWRNCRRWTAGAGVKQALAPHL